MAHTFEQVNLALGSARACNSWAYNILSEELVDLRAQRQKLLDALERLGSMEAFGRSTTLVNAGPELSARIEFAQKTVKEFGVAPEIVAPPVVCCAKCHREINYRGNEKFHEQSCGNFCIPCGPCFCPAHDG